MNKYENMEIDSYSEIDNLYTVIGYELDELIDGYVAVYGKHDLMDTLIKMMIPDGYTFRYADFDFMDTMSENEVYMMFIHPDSSFSVEPAYNLMGVVMEHDATITFISMDDCKQDIIDYCVNSDKDVVLFDFDIQEDCECCDCIYNDINDSESIYISKGEDGNPVGFSKSWSTVKDGVHCYSSYSHYSSDLDALKSVASDFGIELR